MPEYDALHTDAHRVNAFAAGHVFTAVELNKLHYAPPGTERWATFEVVARSRGKELCVGLREAGFTVCGANPFCPACAAAGKPAGDANSSWFPSAHSSPRAIWPRVAHDPPAIVDVVSASGVVLITLQRIMDGALRELLPGAAVPRESLLTLRREDGAAMAFVCKEDSTRTVQALGYEPGGRLLLGQWTESSSPDPLYEYAAFRARVLDLLNADPLGMLSKPICELLLEPRWFNGVGNYLRAEILHRAGVPPFESAKVVLTAAREAACGGSSSLSSPDQAPERAPEREPERVPGREPGREWGATAAGAAAGTAAVTVTDGEPQDVLSMTRDILCESICVRDADWLHWLQCYDGPARSPRWHAERVAGHQVPTGPAGFAGQLGSKSEKDGKGRQIFYRGPRGPLGNVGFTQHQLSWREQRQPQQQHQEQEQEQEHEPPQPPQPPQPHSPQPPAPAPATNEAAGEPPPSKRARLEEETVPNMAVGPCEPPPSKRARLVEETVPNMAVGPSVSTAVSPGVLLRLDELASCAPGSSVRVLGKVLRIEHEDGWRAVIELHQARLTVDLSHLPMDGHAFHKGDLFQFLGELLVDEHGSLLLRARIARSFQGVDVGLYERAVEVKRAFLQQVPG